MIKLKDLVWGEIDYEDETVSINEDIYETQHDNSLVPASCGPTFGGGGGKPLTAGCWINYLN